MIEAALGSFAGILAGSSPLIAYYLARRYLKKKGKKAFFEKKGAAV